MKRKLFFFMMALLPVVAWADDGDQFMVDSLWYRVTSESLKTVELEGYGMGDVPTGHFDGVPRVGEAPTGDFVIPTTVNGYSVTGIGNFALYECSDLTSVIIPETVTSIGDFAFGVCSSLKSVSFAEGSRLMCIGDDAFYQCTSLTSITIPSNVTSIGNFAFCQCTSLTSVTIPSCMAFIEIAAFYKCDNMTDVYCYAEWDKLTWDTSIYSSFKYGKQTLCHVKADQLEAYKEKFGNVNVTFVGDLADGIETLTANSVKGNAVYNLAGQRIGGMAKGLNIVDGRKVMVK